MNVTGVCAKCRKEGPRYGFTDDDMKAIIFPISSGIYRGMTMCAKCCVAVFGHAEPKNL
jgi:hypothetical protein